MALRKRNHSIKIEGTQIAFKPNFEGREEQFNREGDRYFNVVVAPDQVDPLTAEGWNVKRWLSKEAEEGEEPTYFIKVKVSYKFKPPRIVLITSGGRTPLDEETCDMIDWLDLEYIDVILDASYYTMNGRDGISAYLKTGYFVVREDDLEKKYAHLPLIGVDPILALPPGEDPDIIDIEGGEWVEDEERLAIEA